MTEVTLDQLKLELEAFFLENKRFPTREELNSSNSLSANVKAIERKWGGLKNLRKLLNIPTLGLMVQNKKEKHHEDLFLIQEKILKTFPKTSVTLGSLIKVDYQDINFNVDTISASNRQSFVVCLNSKIKKNENEEIKTYIVDMNNSDYLASVLLNRKNPTPINLEIIKLDKFTEILAKYKPLVVESNNDRR